jgi:N-dimethylarginine dimethylaminohydrolase
VDVREVAVPAAGILDGGAPQDGLVPDRELTGLRAPYTSSFPIVLMSAPFSLATDAPNNQSMRDLSDAQRAVDPEKADREFVALYRAVAAEALVYVLPSTPGLQDQVYVSNLLVVPAHRPELAVISNLATAPRRGESMPGRSFLAELGYDVVQAPKYLEGEADLKHLRDDVYVGAHGSRTTLDALRWFAGTVGGRVIPFQLGNPYLYHLDCVVMPVSPEACVVCADACDPETLARIGRFVEVIPVDLELALAGVTNCIVVGSSIICGTGRSALERGDPRRAVEERKVAFLASVCERTGRELLEFPVGEFSKSGAALSCLVAHLRRV